MGDCHIGVFGAGIVGLNTALELQKQLRNARITIVADKFADDTTSDKAAGHFSPSDYFSGPTPEITQKWVDDSYSYYNNLVSLEGVGIKEISGYMLSNISRSKVENRFLEKVLSVYQRVEDDELSTISPGDWKFGTYSTTLLIECRQFQPWAMKRFQRDGGKILTGGINSFSEVSKYGKFDIVMNCTGLGARSLCNDKRLVPIRGQVIKVSAPWLDKFYVGDDDAYIYPGIWAATLGGTRDFFHWKTEVSMHDSAAIWEKCARILPRLTTASVLKVAVGLRPHRDVVRVEPEIINGLKVVHNYGHGSCGVTTAPGTAKTAACIAVDLLKGTSAKL